MLSHMSYPKEVSLLGICQQTYFIFHSYVDNANSMFPFFIQHNSSTTTSLLLCLWASSVMNFLIDEDGVGKQLDIQVKDIDHSYHVKSALWAAKWP